MSDQRCARERCALSLELRVDSGLLIGGGLLGGRGSLLGAVLLLIGGVGHLAQLVLLLEFTGNDSQVVD